MQSTEAVRALPDFPGNLDGVTETAATPSEKWLDFLFYPGRFSTASIETALYIYRKGRGLPVAPSGRGLSTPELPLKERLTQAIASKIILRRLANEEPDYDRYQSDIQVQWKTFFSLLSHLHTRRHDSIGFAFDVDDAMPWSVCADFVAPVRLTSHFDKLTLNSHLLEDGRIDAMAEEVSNRIFAQDEEVFQCQLLATAKQFSDGLSPNFTEKFRNYVALEATGYATGDGDKQRMQALYETHNFSAEVMDDDFQALEASAENLGGLGNLREDIFLGVLEGIEKDLKPEARDQGKLLSRYGDKLTIAVAQETLERDRGALMDLLTLVVFMYGDLDQVDLHPEFVGGIGQIYDALMLRIKHNEMLSWLARYEVAEPPRQHRSSRSPQMLGSEVVSVTLFERIFIGDWISKSDDDEPMSKLLTIWSKQWTYGPDLSNEWSGVTGHVMAFLIKEHCYELATEFQKFLSQGEDAPSWLRYLEGRLLIVTGDYAPASLKFKGAAEGCTAEATRIATSDTAGLLSPEERNYFGAGQSAYFQHVSALFEKLKIFAYTADFASLALEHLENGIDHAAALEEIDRRKGMMDSPNLQKTDNAMREIDILKMNVTKDEIRNRLFNALVQTGRFKEAFEALVGINEPALKKKALEGLIEKCVKQDAVSELLDMRFEDGDLGQEADAVLLGLAKKRLASGSSSGPPYHQILYAFRTQRSNFRGAAEILREHLDRLRHTSYKNGAMQDLEDETLVQAYVLLINTLACCGEADAWLLEDPIEELGGRKRRLVTLADVRKEYAAELDRRSDALFGRFPLVGGGGGEGMDVL